MARHIERIDPGDLVPSAQVCRELGVHPSTVSRWVKDKVLIPVQKGPSRNGAFWFRRADVDALAAQRHSA